MTFMNYWHCFIPEWQRNHLLTVLEGNPKYHSTEYGRAMVALLDLGMVDYGSGNTPYVTDLGKEWIERNKAKWQKR